jgi:GNAT superfamily N-acetyltransferase
MTLRCRAHPAPQADPGQPPLPNAGTVSCAIRSCQAAGQCSRARDAIEHVVVDQDARGHGVATALTMAAIDLAQQQGAAAST